MSRKDFYIPFEDSSKSIYFGAPSHPRGTRSLMELSSIAFNTSLKESCARKQNNTKYILIIWFAFCPVCGFGHFNTGCT